MKNYPRNRDSRCCSVFGRLPRNGVTQNVGVPTDYVLTVVDGVTTDVWHILLTAYSTARRPNGSPTHRRVFSDRWRSGEDVWVGRVTELRTINSRHFCSWVYILSHIDHWGETPLAMREQGTNALWNIGGGRHMTPQVNPKFG